MNDADPLLETKLDILKVILQDQRGEMQYRREREYRIFTWSSSILTAFIGVLLITKQSDIPWKTYGIWGNLVASLAVLLIATYSIQWLLRNERFRSQNGQVIGRVSRLLHGFDRGYFTTDDTALFPAEWARFRRDGERSGFARLRSRLFAVNYLSATVLLGVLAVIMIWLPKH